MAAETRRKAEAEVRDRLAAVRAEIADANDYADLAATHDYEYRMADARIRALTVERNELKEILGDL